MRWIQLDAGTRQRLQSTESQVQEMRPNRSLWKCCKTKLTFKRDRKEQVRKIDSSEDTDYSTSDWGKSESAESVNRIAEISRHPKKRVAELLTVKAIVNGKQPRTRQLHRTGKVFEFMFELNGKKTVAILDTGSPISILAQNSVTEIKPKRVIRKESARRFVDVNGRPLYISKRYKILTELNGIEQDVIWGIVDTDTKPIIGMDNFDRLGLHLMQSSPKSD